MKKISRWASRHTRMAVVLLFLCEVTNAVNGLLLGISLPGDLPAGWLHTGMVCLMGTVVGIRFCATRRQAIISYRLSRQYVMGLFLINFLLFGLLGGLWEQRIQTPVTGSAAFGSRRVAMVSDTLTPTDSSFVPVRPLSKNVATPDAPAGKRVLYVVLALLGFIVTYIAAGLACSIACAGYGFLALIVFYAGLGGLAGSALFFSRAFRKNLKSVRDMTTQERRSDGRTFRLAWLFLIGIFSLIFLLGAIL